MDVKKTKNKCNKHLNPPFSVHWFIFPYKTYLCAFPFLDLIKNDFIYSCKFILVMISHDINPFVLLLTNEKFEMKCHL